MKYSIIYHILLFALLLLGVNKSGFAGHDPAVIEHWEGAQVNVGMKYFIQDDKWPTISPPIADFVNGAVTTDVILGINLSHPDFQAQAYEVEVDMRVTYQGEQQNATTVERILKVNYDPARGSVMAARSSFQLTQAHYTEILFQFLLLPQTLPL